MKKLSFLHYSPTGATCKIGRKVGENIALAASLNISKFDLTAKGAAKPILGAEHLAVVAVPVFSGRVPAHAIEKIKKIDGQGAMAVSLVVYGNRAYEDALLELNDTLKEQGFAVIASGAFVARHSIINEIAANRPDAQDDDFAKKFAAQVNQKLASGASQKEVQVPGKRPYREVAAGGITPLTASSCISCGKCAMACPVQAIPQEDFTYTDSAKCILCMRCVCMCPPKARALPAEYRAKVASMLAQVASERRENEVFL